MNNITNALINTFPNCNIKIKKNIIHYSEKQNIFDLCKNIDINDTDNDIHWFYYSNPIFSFELIGNKLIFKTKYLSPCMFILNTYFKAYNIIDGIYFIELDDFSKSNDLISQDEIIFNPKNIIPIEYIKMLVDFIDYDKNKLVGNIKFELVQDDMSMNLDFNNFISSIDKIQINKDFLDKSYIDYNNNNLNIELKILDPSWIVLDKRLKLSNNNKNYSDIVDKFLNWIKKSNFTLFSSNVCDYKLDFIETINKSEGGIDLSNVFESFGYSQIVKKNEYDYHKNFMRCCCDCYYCINRFNLNIKMIHSNKYSGSNSDLLCIVIFYELLCKFGLVTELIIHDDKYTNKQNNLFLEYYYWIYGYYNK